jgi:hypothetical protein
VTRYAGGPRSTRQNPTAHHSMDAVRVTESSRWRDIHAIHKPPGDKRSSVLTAEHSRVVTAEKLGPRPRPR